MGSPITARVRYQVVLGASGGPLLLPAIWGWVILASTGVAAGETPTRPNVLLVMTDDQGYGDLGFHGNPKVRTPNLDRLARESTRLTSFSVSPVCSPTRASLLTGRYNYRTGVVDTYLGRSLMHPDEVTLAEMLAAAGYRTGLRGLKGTVYEGGIFQWHRGDRPEPGHAFAARSRKSKLLRRRCWSFSVSTGANRRSSRALSTTSLE